MQFANGSLTKFVTKLVTKKRLQFVSRLLTKKASNLLAELMVWGKVNKLLTNWRCLSFWPIALGSAY